MDILDVLDEINQALDSDQNAAGRASVQIPVALRDAARIAVAHLGVAPTVARFIAEALRNALIAAVRQAALEAHFERYPWVRPSLAEVALAKAELEASPLAEQPELLERAAEAVFARHPDADARDVLMWAEASLLQHPPDPSEPLRMSARDHVFDPNELGSS